MFGTDADNNIPRSLRLLRHRARHAVAGLSCGCMCELEHRGRRSERDTVSVRGRGVLYKLSYTRGDENILQDLHATFHCLTLAAMSVYVRQVFLFVPCRLQGMPTDWFRNLVNQGFCNFPKGLPGGFLRILDSQAASRQCLGRTVRPLAASRRVS